MGRELGVWEGEIARGWGDVRRMARKSCWMVEDVSLARKSCLSPCIQSCSKIYYIVLEVELEQQTIPSKVI
jgi:hypothetical protein